MFKTNQSVAALTKRVKYALQGPQTVPAFASQSKPSDAEQGDVLTRRLRRARRHTRRRIDMTNVRSGWY